MPDAQTWYPRLGRRGGMLLLMAGLWAYVGTGIVIGPVVEVPGLIHTQWPTWVRVGEWYVAAVFGIVHAWRLRDTAAWALLLLPPLIRAVSFLWGWVVWLVPGGEAGYPRGLWAAVLYLFMCGTVLLCAGWPDHPPRPAVAREGEARGGRG
ncbi:hypothetical protein [Ornithinimicrobium cerasi]|uniref:hypothetical protein n=1 Tax=Ornithinimicrobium cerasi TaxID=2248773 RepID=UPI000EFFA0D0|nr:hypothetical protein [Ornithinimicrobium cerasi]